MLTGTVLRLGRCEEEAGVEGAADKSWLFVNPALSLPSGSKNHLAFSPFPEGIFGVFCIYADHCYYYQYYWRPTFSFVSDVYTKDSFVSRREKVAWEGFRRGRTSPYCVCRQVYSVLWSGVDVIWCTRVNLICELSVSTVPMYIFNTCGCFFFTHSCVITQSTPKLYTLACGGYFPRWWGVWGAQMFPFHAHRNLARILVVKKT